jgi:hypothetical protein
MRSTQVYPKASGLAAWSENCKWYSSSLPLVQLYRYFVSQSSEFCYNNRLCYFSTSVYCCKHIFRYDSIRKLLVISSYIIYSYIGGVMIDEIGNFDVSYMYSWTHMN